MLERWRRKTFDQAISGRKWIWRDQEVRAVYETGGERNGRRLWERGRVVANRPDPTALILTVQLAPGEALHGERWMARWMGGSRVK